MKPDKRPVPAKRPESARIACGFGNARKAAEYFCWIYETCIRHEEGIRGITRILPICEGVQGE